MLLSDYGIRFYVASIAPIIRPISVTSLIILLIERVLKFVFKHFFEFNLATKLLCKLLLLRDSLLFLCYCILALLFLVIILEHEALLSAAVPLSFHQYYLALLDELVDLNSKFMAFILSLNEPIFDSFSDLTFLFKRIVKTVKLRAEEELPHVFKEQTSETIFVDILSLEFINEA